MNKPNIETVKVCIGGSSNILYISDQVTNTIDTMIEKGFEILVGDAIGADKCVQDYLYSKSYEMVTVYTVYRPRINVGNWKLKQIQYNNEKGFEYYSLTDKIMVRDANYGLMIWNSKSKGTLNNIINLIQQGKSLKVFVSNTNEMMKVSSLSSLYYLLTKCDLKEIDPILNELNFYKRVDSIN